MSTANAYFYSEKPLHARRTPHASARGQSLSSPNLTVSGSALTVEHTSRHGDRTKLDTASDHTHACAPGYPETHHVVERKVRRVHATTTSLPEYRTLSAAPQHVSTPRIDALTDTPNDHSEASFVGLNTARLAYVLYTPQGSRPLAPLRMKRLDAGGSGALSSATAQTAKGPQAAKSASTHTTLPSSVTLPPHMVDTHTGVHCLYIKDAQSQLLYIPPGTSVEMDEPSHTQTMGSSASHGLPRGGGGGSGGAKRTEHVPPHGERRPGSNSTMGLTTASTAVATPQPAPSSSTSVLGIQFCVCPNSPETPPLSSSTATVTDAQPFALTFECTFAGGRRLLLSNTVEAVQPCLDTNTTGRGHLRSSAKVPLHCLSVGQWTVLYLDLERLQHALFYNPVTPKSSARAARALPLRAASSDTTRSLQSVRVLCGRRSTCGVLVRRVVVMPTMPITALSAQSESVLFPLHAARTGLPLPRQLAALVPDALRMPTPPSSSTNTSMSASTMLLLFVRTGSEAALTRATTAGEAATPAPYHQTNTTRLSPHAVAEALSDLSAMTSEDSDGDDHGLRRTSSEHARGARAPRDPPPSLPLADSSSQPTALAQLRAMLQEGGDEGHPRGVAPRDSDAEALRATARSNSRTVSDLYEPHSVSIPSPLPVAPLNARHHTPLVEEGDDVSEEGFHVERVTAAPAVATTGAHARSSLRRPQRVVSEAAPAPIHALEASPLPTPLPTEAVPKLSSAHVPDMLAAMHDRIERIDAVLRQGSEPHHRRRDAAISPLSRARPASLGPPPARTPSASPSEDKAVQTDAWCALDLVGGSRSRLSRPDDGAVDDGGGAGASSMPPPRHHSAGPSRGALEPHASHHYIPLSALKDEAGRPPRSSATFFARPCNLLSMPNVEANEDAEDFEVARQTHDSHSGLYDTQRDAQMGSRRLDSARSSLLSATPAATVATGSASEPTAVPFESRPGPHRVLYYGDVSTPTLVSLTPAPTMTAPSQERTPSAHARPQAMDLPLVPPQQHVRLDPPSHATAARNAHKATVALVSASSSRARQSTSPSQPQSTPSQGMTATTTTHTPSSQPTPTPDTVEVQMTSNAAVAPASAIDVATAPEVGVADVGDGTAAEPLTQRVLDFWSSTEQPLSAAAVLAAASSSSGSRPATRLSHRRQSRGDRDHRHRSPREQTRADLVAPPSSARHEDPAMSSWTSSTGRLPPSSSQAHSQRASRHHHRGDRTATQADEPPTQTQVSALTAASTNQLVFNSAQYESVQAWAASLDKGTPETTDRAEQDVHRSRHDHVAPQRTRHERLPSHRGVFARLRQQLAISSDSDESATSATAAPDRDDVRAVSVSDPDSPHSIEGEQGEDRPITVTELQLGSNLTRLPPRDVSVAANTNTMVSATTVQTDRTSWTFHSTSLPLRESELGQSTTHPWATSPTNVETSVSRVEEEETLDLSFDRSDGYGAVGRPPTPPRFSLYASGGPIVVPPTPQPFFTSGPPELPASNAQDTATRREPPKESEDGATSTPDAAVASSVAWQRAESARLAETLASHDAVRLAYDPVSATAWREADAEDDCHTPHSAHHSPITEAHGTPLQWPLLRNSRFSSTGGERIGSSRAGGGAAVDNHPRVDSSRPVTNPSARIAGRLDAPTPVAAVAGQDEADAGGVEATWTTRAVRRRPLPDIPTPPHEGHAPAAAPVGEAESTKDERVGNDQARLAADAELRAEDDGARTTVSSDARGTAPFTYQPPPSSSVLPYGRYENTPQAMRYASAYSSIASSLAPSAHANGSTSDGGGTASPVARPPPPPPPPSIVLTAPERSHTVAPRPVACPSAAPTSHPVYPMHRHYSLPHLTQYHRLRSAGAIEVRPTQQNIQARLSRATSAGTADTSPTAPTAAGALRLTATNAAPEILFSPPPLQKGRSPSLTTTVEAAMAGPASVSGRYMYDPVLECYLDRHAHVYVQAEDIET